MFIRAQAKRRDHKSTYSMSCSFFTVIRCTEKTSWAYNSKKLLTTKIFGWFVTLFLMVENDPTLSNSHSFQITHLPLIVLLRRSSISDQGTYIRW